MTALAISQLVLVAPTPTHATSMKTPFTTVDANTLLVWVVRILKQTITMPATPSMTVLAASQDVRFHQRAITTRTPIRTMGHATSRPASAAVMSMRATTTLPLPFRTPCSVFIQTLDLTAQEFVWMKMQTASATTLMPSKWTDRASVEKVRFGMKHHRHAFLRLLALEISTMTV